MLPSIPETAMRNALLLFIGLLLVLGYFYQLLLSKKKPPQNSGQLCLGIIAFPWGIIKSSSISPKPTELCSDPKF